MAESGRHFDVVAEIYDSVLPGHIQAHYRRKRTKMLGPMLAGGLGLDVGCGTGVLMDALRPYGTLFGADDSLGMLHILTTNRCGQAVRAVSHLLPFASESFDLVFSVAVFHHLAAPERVTATIQEMARVTRPGGRVVIWDHNPRNPYWPCLMRRMPQDNGTERLISAAEICSALKAEGVRNMTVWTSGFVPEFMPRVLLPLARSFEWVVERMPVVKRFAAHNVVIAEK